jgi:hypothetical protein
MSIERSVASFDFTYVRNASIPDDVGSRAISTQRGRSSLNSSDVRLLQCMITASYANLENIIGCFVFGERSQWALRQCTPVVTLGLASPSSPRIFVRIGWGIRAKLINDGHIRCLFEC